MPSTSSGLPGLGLGQEHRLEAEALVAHAGAGRRAGCAPGSRRPRPRTPRRPPRRAAAARRPATSPVRNACAPSNSRNRPCPPESTTPASRRIASSVGVFATAFCAASTVGAHDRVEALPALGAHDRGGRRLADDGQDRALDRLRDGAVGGLRALVERVREVERVEPRSCPRGPRRGRAGSGW